MNKKISNKEIVEPGTLVRRPKGKISYEVIETRKPGSYLKGRLRDTRNNNVAGWSYLDEFVRVDKENEE